MHFMVITLNHLRFDPFFLDPPFLLDDALDSDGAGVTVGAGVAALFLDPLFLLDDPDPEPETSEP